MRGEYVLNRCGLRFYRELPPRARRIHRCYAGNRIILGTTSACAENTFEEAWHGGDYGNYLRVRGEYDPTVDVFGYGEELPPRARRIHDTKRPAQAAKGTTSACAENTRTGHMPQLLNRNYLRVRGEYTRSMNDRWSIQELPPRARRIRGCGAGCAGVRGTTSACAENTAQPAGHRKCAWNYLRVRGEYTP